MVNGTSFKDGLKSALVHDVVALGLADAQTKIGGIFSDAQGNPVNGGEGSFGHVALHAIAGCVAAEAQGADCAAGAAGGAVQAIYSGTLKGTKLTSAQIAANGKLIGSIVGLALSGGKAKNVAAAASIAQSGIINNYLTHTQINTFATELTACNGKHGCIENLKVRYRGYSQDNNTVMLACKTTACWQFHRNQILAAQTALGALKNSAQQPGQIYNTIAANGGNFVAALQLQSSAPLSGLTGKVSGLNFKDWGAAKCGGINDQICLREFNSMQTIAGQLGAFAKEEAAFQILHRADYKMFTDKHGKVVAAKVANNAITAFAAAHNLVPLLIENTGVALARSNVILSATGEVITMLNDPAGFSIRNLANAGGRIGGGIYGGSVGTTACGGAGPVAGVGCGVVGATLGAEVGGIIAQTTYDLWVYEVRVNGG